MHVRIDKKDFLGLLDRIKGIPPQKTVSTILGHILLETIEEGLRVTAMNYEVSVQLTTQAEIVEGGLIAVPAKRLIDAVARAKEDTIELVTEEGGEWVHLSSGTFSLRLPLMDPKNMPSVQSVEEKARVKLPEGVLLEVVDKCGFAMSQDETRPNINGMFMKFFHAEAGPMVEAVATDGRRLSLVRRRVTEIESTSESLEVLIHRKGVGELRKFLKGELDNVEMVMDRKGVKVIRPEGFLVVRQIDLEYPNYEMVIPKDYNLVFEVEPQMLVDAIRRVSVSAPQDTGLVSLQILEGPSPTLKLLAEDPEGGSATDEIPVKFKGEPIELMYNYSLLIDAINVFIKAPAVEFRVVDDYSATMIVEAGGSQDVIELVMPITRPR